MIRVLLRCGAGRRRGAVVHVGGCAVAVDAGSVGHEYAYVVEHGCRAYFVFVERKLFAPCRGQGFVGHLQGMLHRISRRRVPAG